MVSVLHNIMWSIRKSVTHEAKGIIVLNTLFEPWRTNVIFAAYGFLANPAKLSCLGKNVKDQFEPKAVADLPR